MYLSYTGTDLLDAAGNAADTFTQLVDVSGSSTVLHLLTGFLQQVLTLLEKSLLCRLTKI